MDAALAISARCGGARGAARPIAGRRVRAIACVAAAMLACSSRGAAPAPAVGASPPAAVERIDAAAVAPAAGGASDAAPALPVAGGPPTRPDDRVAAAAPTDAWYRTQEHPELANACARDADCFVGGCAQYACTAARDVFDACDDAPALPPIGARCGCVAGQCIWWRRRDYAGPGAPGQPCVGGGYCIHDDLACVADRCTPKARAR